jgi:hypothetical protein
LHKKFPTLPLSRFPQRVSARAEPCAALYPLCHTKAKGGRKEFRVSVLQGGGRIQKTVDFSVAILHNNTRGRKKTDSLLFP